MPVLLLALDIADTVAQAEAEFDYSAKAAELLAMHPEASVGREVVAQTLREEFSFRDPTHSRWRVLVDGVA